VGSDNNALGADEPKVAGLVYVAAFALQEGESLGALLGGGPPQPALAHLIVDEHGFGWLPEADFVGHFAADVEPTKARVLCAVQQGLSMSTFEDVMGEPAWKSRPSWYLVATGDQAIPPDDERMFASRMGATTIEVASSHLAMVSNPHAVTKLIKEAADTIRSGSARSRPLVGRGDESSGSRAPDVATPSTNRSRNKLARRPCGPPSTRGRRGHRPYDRKDTQCR
jgi:hypothetical protein